MNLFLHIQITDTPETIKFYNPVIAKLKENNLDLAIYDIDNHSEPFMIGYINKLFSDTDKKIIFIDTAPNSNFSKLIPLFTNFLDNPEGIRIFIKGNNQKLERMISIFAHFTFPETTQENEVIERIISEFL